jgi:hypothetical protein
MKVPPFTLILGEGGKFIHTAFFDFSANDRQICLHETRKYANM